MARILICDDDDAVRKELGRALEPLNHALEFARDGNEALHLLGEHPFDLLLTDLVVPGHSGLDLLEHMRNHRISIPVVVCSAFLTQDIKKEISRHADVALVEKPFRHETLLTAVNRFLKEEFPT